MEIDLEKKKIELSMKELEEPAIDLEAPVAKEEVNEEVKEEATIEE